jgi:hypothetical protein
LALGAAPDAGSAWPGEFVAAVLAMVRVVLSNDFGCYRPLMIVFPGRRFARSLAASQAVAAGKMANATMALTEAQ